MILTNKLHQREFFAAGGGSRALISGLREIRYFSQKFALRIVAFPHTQPPSGSTQSAPIYLRRDICVSQPKHTLRAEIYAQRYMRSMTENGISHAG